MMMVAVAVMHARNDGERRQCGAGASPGDHGNREYNNGGKSIRHDFLKTSSLYVSKWDAI